MVRVPRLGLVFLSSVLGKLLGFLRVQAIAVTLGASALTDALLMSLTVVTFFDLVFLSGSAILIAQAAYIARLTRHTASVGLLDYVRTAATWSVLALAFGIAISVFAIPLSNVIAPGFTQEARESFARMCRIGGLIPLASALMAFTSALNRLHGREVLYTTNQIVINGLSLLALVGCRTLEMSTAEAAEIMLLAVLFAHLLMTVVQTASLTPHERRHGVALFAREIRSGHLISSLGRYRQELVRNLPVIASLLLQQLLVFVSYGFASRVGQGALTVIGVGERITNVVFALFVMSFVTVLEPRWAHAYAAQRNGLREIGDDILVLGLALVPLTSVLMVAGDGVATILFAHGEFAGEASAQLGAVVRAFGASLPGAALAVLYVRLLVISGRTRGVAYVNGALAGLHALLCWLLTRHFGVTAIPLSFACATALQAFAFWWLLPRELRVGSPRTGLQVAAVAACCLATSYIAGSVCEVPALRVGVVTIIATISTVAAAHLFRVPYRPALRRLAKM